MAAADKIFWPFRRSFPVKDYFEERVMAVAGYIIEHNATVRQAAKQTGISKSTVHMVVTKWNGFAGRYL